MISKWVVENQIYDCVLISEAMLQALSKCPG